MANAEKVFFIVGNILNPNTFQAKQFETMNSKLLMQCFIFIQNQIGMYEAIKNNTWKKRLPKNSTTKTLNPDAGTMFDSIGYAHIADSTYYFLLSLESSLQEQLIRKVGSNKQVKQLYKSVIKELGVAIV